MKNVFVDANVVIDFLINREPFSTRAATVFDLAAQKHIKIFVSATSFNVVYYIVRQRLGHNATIRVLRELSDLVTILDVTGHIIQQAIESGNSDFEDSIQYYTAISTSKVQGIVTRDPKGFRKSQVAVLSPQELIQRLHKEI